MSAKNIEMLKNQLEMDIDFHYAPFLAYPGHPVSPPFTLISPLLSPRALGLDSPVGLHLSAPAFNAISFLLSPPFAFAKTKNRHEFSP